MATRLGAEKVKLNLRTSSVCTYLLESTRLFFPQVMMVETGCAEPMHSDGFIKAIGPAETIHNQFSQAEFEMVIDCSGKCALPGFVDAHTHPVWAGDQVHEFAMKLAGATYMDIHQAGGGIHFTVDKTEAASEEELYNSFKERLERMLRTGTTLVECKSGYGLKLETELKMLRVIERAQRELDIDISSTYCGAHSVPKWEHLIYQFGGHQEIIESVIIKGNIVFTNKRVLGL
ncbi:putative imidazolonepropionase [Gastrophryne carolinensis]